MTPPMVTTSAKKIFSKELQKDIPIPEDLDALMTEEAAAAFMGVTSRGMQNYRLTGKGPEYIKLGERCVRYTKRKLIEHAEINSRKSTSGYGKEENV